MNWILGKINQESIYRNFCETLKKLLDETSIELHPIPHGIGVGVAFNHRGSAEVLRKKVEVLLEETGIEYSNEYSAAGWGNRYKISKSKQNLVRIENLQEMQRITLTDL